MSDLTAAGASSAADPIRRFPKRTFRPAERIILPLLAILLCSSQASPAETVYYIAPTGSDANSCRAAQSPSTPKQTFASMWGCLSPGDVLIARNGTYNQELTAPRGKAGTSAKPIRVRAETDGAVMINGSANLIANSYLTFEGLRMKGRSGESVFAIGSSDSAATASHHITLVRMGLECPLTGTEVNDNACVEIYAGAHDNLLEDCWVWGGGRYTVMLYGRDTRGRTAVTGADNNTLRRLVLRVGPNISRGGNPQAALSLYYASNNIVQNVLSLDSQPNSDSSNSAFYITAHATPPTASGNKYYGIVALNTTGGAPHGFYLDVDRGGISSNTEIHDSVFWGNEGQGVVVYNSVASNNAGMLIRRILSGHNKADGYSNFTDGVSVRSSIFYQNGGYGLRSGSRGSTAESFNLIFGNKAGARINLPAGANDIKSDPLLSYILRTEPGTPCKGAGEGGSDCGPNLVFRYGKDGTRFGEAGYDALTDVPLWPWPNEDRIKREMCQQSGITHGFCSATSLTGYIWEYLGNRMPTSRPLVRDRSRRRRPPRPAPPVGRPRSSA
jgi:hypothetical protein